MRGGYTQLHSQFDALLAVNVGPAMCELAAIEIGERDVPVIEGTWHIRPNYGGAVVYKYSHDDSKRVGLNPREAVTVALCDGSRCLADVQRLLGRVLEVSPEACCEVWNRLREKNRNDGPFLVPLASAATQVTLPNTVRLLAELAAYQPQPQQISRLQAPLSLVLLPSYQCRTDCVYCYAQRPSLPLAEYLSPERWVEVLTEAGEFGLDLLTFSGGDPLTYGGIDKLLEVARRYRMKYILPTKMRISRSRAHRLAELVGDGSAIQVSVDSFDPEIAAALTRTPGYEKSARESIQNLVAAGVTVRTNTVVTPLNLASVDSLVRELHALGVFRAHLINYYRTYYRHEDQWYLTRTQMDELNDTARRLQSELAWPELKCNAGSRDFSVPGLNGPEEWKGRANCSGGSSSCVILPNGDIVLCEQVPHSPPFVIGNVREHSLIEVWNSERLFEFVVPSREKFGSTPCATCEEFDSCHRIYGRCFRDAYFHYGTLFAPSPNCPKAPPGLRMS